MKDATGLDQIVAFIEREGMLESSSATGTS
jgi:hypothetical protein